MNTTFFILMKVPILYCFTKIFSNVSVRNITKIVEMVWGITHATQLICLVSVMSNVYKYKSLNTFIASEMSPSK